MIIYLQGLSVQQVKEIAGAVSLSAGPASFMVVDPDGNTILVDQHEADESSRSVFGDPVILELYDLSDPARLSAASAETIPVTPMPDYPKPGCRDWSGDAGLTAQPRG